METFINKLANNEPFTFSRWGDGEWNCILGKQGVNCDGHEYFPDLRKGLIEVLEDKPEYYLGMQGFAYRRMGDQIESFLSERKLTFDWMNADIFHHASIKDRFKPFLEVLWTKDVTIIGPASHKSLGELIEIPEKNCWKDPTAFVRCVEKSFKSKDKVFLFCAGMASNVWIHELYKLNPKNYYLDMGSVFMPYLGLSNRSYHPTIIERLK